MLVVEAADKTSSLSKSVFGIYCLKACSCMKTLCYLAESLGIHTLLIVQFQFVVSLFKLIVEQLFSSV